MQPVSIKPSSFQPSSFRRACFRRACFFLGLILCLTGFAMAQTVSGKSKPDPAPQHSAQNPPALPPPGRLPDWIKLNPTLDATFFNMSSHAAAVRQPITDDLYVGDMCHAMVEEALATGQTGDLETGIATHMRAMLMDPGSVVSEEARRPLPETYSRKYSALGHKYHFIQAVEMEAHETHYQIVQVLTNPDLTPTDQERQITDIAQKYFRLPIAITPLPMNMAWLDSQPYSGAFRRRFPKTNALLWAHHWLSNIVFDTLSGKAKSQQWEPYRIIEEQYWQVELSRSSRSFMPMLAETSPAFAVRFPQLSNLFDNLHMLHDMINDILTCDWMSPTQKEQQLQRAVWLFASEAHKNEKSGSVQAGEALHDHRFVAGMPGMGLMKGATPKLMFLPPLGWMRMDSCHHCSVLLPEGKEAWRSARVTADGWTMRVRCAQCARELAAQTKGRAILQLPTENPQENVVILSDEHGNLFADTGVVFLEREGSHAGCSDWSRAFTSRAAFAAYLKTHPELKDAVPLTLEEWSRRIGKKPDTYVRPQGPVDNPYVSAGEKPRAEKTGPGEASQSRR